MNTQTPQRLNENFGRRHPVGTSDTGDHVDLLELLRSIWRRKWIVIGCASILGGMVALGVSLVQPRYSATAKVMLNPRETRVVTSQEVVSDLDLSNPVIESEVALIRSSVLLETTIREIGMDQMTEFDPTVVTEPLWSQRLNQAVEWASRLLGRGYVSVPAPEVSAMDVIEVLPEEGIEPPSEQLAEEDDLYRKVVGRLRRYLEVYQEGNSYVITITASAEDNQLVALIVNAIADRYIASQLEERVEGTRSASAWLEAQVEKLRTQVAIAEMEVETHRAEKLTYDGGGIESISQQLAAMSVQLATARADQAAAQARRDQIVELVKSEGFPAAAEILTSPFVTSLRENHSALMRHQAELSTQYGPSHPQRQRQAAEIERADADLKEEVRKIIEMLEAEVDVARIRERSIAGDLLALEERASSISSTSIDLRQLEREAAALRSTYENMLSRLKETRTHEALAKPEAKVIEYALPPASPSYPRSKLLIAAAAVAGLGLGLGIVLVLELSSNTIRTAQQAFRETGLPVLAELPRGGRRVSRFEADPVTVALGDQGERVRHLRNALMFGEGKRPRSIAVGSSIPGESKSETTFALAQVSALTGDKVILIEGDFRRGYASRTYGLANGKGLAEVLQGTARPDEVVRSAEGLGFDILPIGEMSKEAAALFSPEKFRKIIDTLCEKYDVVLIDAPPVLSSADARVVASAVDATILSVKWDSTPASTVRESLRSLADLGVSPRGIVLTQVNPRRIENTQQRPYRSPRRKEDLT